MINENRASLVKYRLELARDCLGSALREIEAEAYKWQGILEVGTSKHTNIYFINRRQ